jgi:tetratricopeptide (TPR) repeat protein
MTLRAGKSIVDRDMANATNALSAEQALAAAVMLRQGNRPAEAEQLYRMVLASNPEHFDSLHAVGVLSLERNAPQEALAPLEKAVAVDPHSAAAHSDLGMALASLERRDDAIAHFEKAIALDPTFATAHYNLGNALKAERRFADAVRHFQQAITLRVDYPTAELGLATTLAKQERHEPAIEHYGKALDARPDWVAALCGLGFSLHLNDQTQEALACYERALVVDPSFPDAHHGIGLTLQAVGRLEESHRAYAKAVELAPGVPGYHRSLGEMKRFRADDPQLAAMEGLAQRMETHGEEQQAALHFGLGKAYADLGRHAIAFEHLLQGNAIRHRLDEYDERAHVDMMRHIEKVFTAELLRRQPGAGDPSRLPVLIVSMPRSGSTLIEQILASHPRVHGAGELRVLGRAVKTFRSRRVEECFPEVAKYLSAEQLRQFGAGYVEELRSREPAAERVTDKMPSNYLYAGLIHMALPNARIIHARRDPLDTCVSCFSQHFGQKSFTSDLGTLGRHYRSYDALMAHWRAVLPPGVMLEVQYEELVADFENYARRIVEFCGLGWDPRCLAFFETQRPVRTASVLQVREPIFTRSIGRWREYEPWLGPLMDALGADSAGTNVPNRQHATPGAAPH